MIFLLLLFLPFKVNGQDIFDEPESSEISPRPLPVSSIYGELLGNGYSFSLNYDYIHKSNAGIRVGITPIFLFDNTDNRDPSNYDDTYSQSFQLLVMGNYFIGQGSHKLEIGGGFVFGFSDNNVNLGLPSYPAFSGTVGYRLIPRKENITVKIAFTPIFSGEEFFPRVGVSIGRLF
ncbi:MAG: hypothetical protein WD357_03245 [Gracilimonas sp.]